MKQILRSFRIRNLAFMLLLFAVSIGISAQDSIVVYSDTTSILEGTTADDGGWSTSPSGFLQDSDFWEETEGHGLMDFAYHILGLTGLFAILVCLLIFLFPLIAIGIIIYLIYRLNREKQRNAYNGKQERYAPEDNTTRNIRYKELAIRRACWGAGLIAVELLADITDVLYIIGVVLLCMAAYNWFSAQINDQNPS